MHPWELRRYTWDEFLWKIEGYRKEKNAAHIEGWRIARFIGALIVNTAGKFVKKKVKETDLVELPGDEKRRKGKGKQMHDLQDQIKQLQTYQNQQFKKAENK